MFLDEFPALADFGCLVHSKPLRYIPDIARVFPGRFSTNSAGLENPLKNTSHLVALRDSLLPKLISGEIRVPEAVAMINEVT